jgi:hypothetical protein
VLNQGARPIGAYNVQNVNGFLAHVLTRRHLRDWYPIDAGARFWSARRPHGGTRRRRSPFMLASWETAAARRIELWLVLCLTVLIAPISWTHYDLLLLIPGAALGPRRASLGERSRVPVLSPRSSSSHRPSSC